MDDEVKNRLKDTIKDLYNFQQKIADFTLEKSLNLEIIQLDFFKSISSIIIGVIGIGYFYNVNLDRTFLFSSLVFSSSILIFSTSLVREKIDEQAKGIWKLYNTVNDETDTGVDKCKESLNNQDEDIFYNWVKNRIKIDQKINIKENYAGETIVFLFYSSVGFLGLSFFSNIYNFHFLSYQTLSFLILVYLLSFKNWSIKFLEILSKKIFVKNKK